ncbi:hypothetical protein F5Y08DRAFT_342170 [Xylaria arbuscula]|nr:hypothetical protein F5Y08DRAFT_342170 [Xylaria arbuscula]
MRTSIIFSLTTAATVATAFNFATDAIDGIYMMGPNDTEPYLIKEINHILVPPATPSSTTPDSASLTQRDTLPISSYNCESNTILDGVNYQQAEAELKSLCATQKIGAASGLVATVGSAQVFGCSWGYSNPCSEDEINQAISYLDSNCGSNLTPGKVYMKSWKKDYGRELSGDWPYPN